MTANDPIEFTRDLGSKGNERCGNRVQFEDENGNPINDSNPLPVCSGTGSELDVNARLIDESGVAYGVKHIINKPRVSSMPYSFDIAEGNVPDHSVQHVNGQILGVGANWGDMWGGAPGTLMVPLLAAAVAMEAVGGAQDTAGGTGISQIEVHYLDTAGNKQQETVQLTGAVPVALAENILHINEVHAVAGGAGSSDPVVASANIDIQGAGGGTVYARIPSGMAQAPRFVFRVPLNVTAYWVDILPSVIALANNADAQLRVVTNINQSDGALLPIGIWLTVFTVAGGAAGSAAPQSQSFPFVFPAGAVFKCQVRRASGSGNADGFITGSGWLE